MPLSIASLASGGGASAAAVREHQRDEHQRHAPAVGAQQHEQPAQLAPAPARRAPAADEVVAAGRARRAHRPATRSSGSRLRNTWSGRPLVGDLRVQLGLASAARRACRARRSRPCSSTTMSSASAIVESRWAMTNVVRPAITSRSAALISRSVVASTDEVASSRMRMRGSARARGRWRSAGAGRRTASARARRRACRSPSGSSAMNPAAWARSAARSISSRGGVRPRVGDVARDRVGEQERVVVDDRDLAPQRRRRRPSRTSAPSISTAPGLRVIQPRQQLHERRLARAGRADERHGRAGLDVQRRRRAATARRRRRRTSRRAARHAPAAGGQRGAPPETIRGSRSRISSSRAPDAVARWASAERDAEHPHRPDQHQQVGVERREVAQRQRPVASTWRPPTSRITASPRFGRNARNGL